MNSFKKLWTALILILTSKGVNAQTAMADVMRENGKIYVVVGVIVIIFALIVIYLVSLDRRLRKVEKEKK